MKNIYKVNEEAVKKIAERVYDNGSTVINRNDLEEMFPELKKESEDERIKKSIIATIHLYYGEPLEDEAKEMIAWLVRRGDKVSAIEGFETEFERQVSHLIASAINREHEYNEGYVKWTANALLNFAKHELEKQNEQWNEDDETTLENTIILLEHYAKGLRDFEKNASITWLKSLKGRVGCEVNCTTTWKPSERQLDVLKSAISELDAYDDSLTELYNDLKKLKE